MVIQPTLDNASKPAARFAKRSMHASAQLDFNSLPRRTHAFRNAVSMNSEPTLGPSLATHVCESKKVERFRAAFTALGSTIHRIATELDQTRLSFVELQAELGKASMEFLQTGRCFRMALETDHKVIRITHSNHITAAVFLPPPFDPQVKHIVKVHV